MESYRLAVRLNPGLMAAQHNLRAAQQRDAVTAEKKLSTRPTGMEAIRLPTGGGNAGRWRWLGGGILGITILAGVGWFALNLVNPPWNIRVVPIPSTAALQNDDGQKGQNNNEVMAKATQLLGRGDVAAAQPLIQALLDRQALKEAGSVLTPVLGAQAENPTINFLMGQLMWRAWVAGDKTYTVDEVRRRLGEAVKLDASNPAYHNALGFVYYEEGKFDRASQAWFRALELLGLAGGQTQQGVTAAKLASVRSSLEALNAYAGLALTLVKAAEKPGASEPDSKIAEARNLRQQVMTAGGIQFLPDELSKKNWLWSEKAIQDWRSLQTK